MTADSRMQPSTCKTPVPIGCCRRNTDNARRLLHGHAGEVPEFHKLSAQRIARGKRQERFVQKEKVIGSRNMHVLDRFMDALPVAVMLVGFLRASVIDQELPHGHGGRAKEMAPALPARIGIADQSDIRLMHQCSGFQRVVRRFSLHALRCQLAKLIIDERKESVGGAGVALFDGVEETREVIHKIKTTGSENASEARS